MHNKYAIKTNNANKWLNVDYREGDTVIYVEKFLNAYHFNSKNEAIDFLNRHKIEIEKCELYRLEVFASPQRWTDKS